MTERASRISMEENNRRVAAWLECVDDAAAAARLGMEYATFSQWRRQIGLPPKGQQPRTVQLDTRAAQWLADRLGNAKETCAGLESDLRAQLKAVPK